MLPLGNELLKRETHVSYNVLTLHCSPDPESSAQSQGALCWNLSGLTVLVVGAVAGQTSRELHDLHAGAAALCGMQSALLPTCVASKTSLR